MSTETYVLPASVMNIIQQLSFQLHVITPTTLTQDRKKRLPTVNVEDDGWATVRTTFKSTVIEKKQGIEKTINDIKACLNKISIKNFECNKDQIIQYIDGLNPTNYLLEIKQIAASIFQVASTNKFFSELYADLYKILMEKYEIFGEILKDFTDHYIENMQTIKHVKQTDDYDEYCKYNQSNDARKATSAFITNLTIKDVLAKDALIYIIEQLQELINTSIDVPDKINEVEEITENLFIILSTSLNHLHAHSNLTKIFDKIREFAAYKPKEKPSLSSRAIFKFMDIVQKKRS